MPTRLDLTAESLDRMCRVGWNTVYDPAAMVNLWIRLSFENSGVEHIDIKSVRIVESKNVQPS
jgi:hypothetical protein